MRQLAKSPWTLLLFVCVHLIRDIDSSLGEDVRPFEKRIPPRGVTSPEEDLHMCSSHFEIHENKIIRTQDSRALGAKYINEKDVGTRDECLRMCCKTEDCNVFVFDESSPGSCYMFDCGTPDDFKCKFTSHQKYTSAISRQLTELEHQIKFTQHEHELTRLRDPPRENNTSATTSTSPPQNKEALAYAFGASSSHSKKGCSRYQFECHKSGECIAIYNVCDGIPQCSDSSDEAPEGCISKTSTTTPVQQLPSVPSFHPEIKGPETYSNGDSRIESSPNNNWPANQHYAANEGSPLLPNPQSYPQNPSVLQNPNMIKSRANYGREGEGLATYRDENQWNNQQYHSGNGRMPQAADRIVQQRPYSQEIPQRQFNEFLPNDYSKYYNENGAYRPYSAQNTQNMNWQPAGHRDIPSTQIEAEGPINRSDYPPNSAPSDYYYEEYRARNQPPFNPLGTYRQPQLPQQNPQMVNRVMYPHQQKDASSTAEESPAKHEAPVVVVASAVRSSTTTPTTTTSTTAKPEEKSKPKEHSSEHISHSNRKVDKLTAESRLSETFLSDDIEGDRTSPSGAILSLVMGLSVTTIMIVLVGCRMRMVRKRIRRGGKSGYAHDADFLVNGMYL